MKSLYVHYMNKYPGGRVHISENSLDVFDAEGVHRLALRKDGAGQLKCVSEELGLPDRHDLSPIPKDARVHKLFKDGKVGLDEKHEHRAKARTAFMKEGKIMSEVEVEAAQAEAKA